jgi:hypothetical protein
VDLEIEKQNCIRELRQGRGAMFQDELRALLTQTGMRPHMSKLKLRTSGKRGGTIPVKEE